MTTTSNTKPSAEPPNTAHLDLDILTKQQRETLTATGLAHLEHTIGTLNHRW